MLYRLSYMSWTHPKSGTLEYLERVAGIEPASSAWKAEVLPLNYTRAKRPPRTPAMPAGPNLSFGGGGWIRTTEAFASDLQSDPFGHSGTPPGKSPASSAIALPLSTDLACQDAAVELARGVEPPTC